MAIDGQSVGGSVGLPAGWLLISPVNIGKKGIAFIGHFGNVIHVDSAIKLDDTNATA